MTESFKSRTESGAASRLPSTGNPSRPTTPVSVPRRFFAWLGWTLPSSTWGNSWGRNTLRRSASPMTRSSPSSRMRGSYRSARAHR